MHGPQNVHPAGGVAGGQIHRVRAARAHVCRAAVIAIVTDQAGKTLGRIMRPRYLVLIASGLLCAAILAALFADWARHGNGNHASAAARQAVRTALRVPAFQPEEEHVWRQRGTVWAVDGDGPTGPYHVTLRYLPASREYRVLTLSAGGHSQVFPD
jgi:hypothetical protein